MDSGLLFMLGGEEERGKQLFEQYIPVFEKNSDIEAHNITLPGEGDLENKVQQLHAKYMDVAAKLTSKGQVTIPKSVREALHLAEGDVVVFRIQGEHAVLARTPRLLELAGSIAVPKSARGAKWEDVVEATKMARAPKRR